MVTIKFLGIFPVTRRQFEFIEFFLMIFFIILAVLAFAYRFPPYIDDPLVIYHSKFLKYAALFGFFLVVAEYQYIIGKLLSYQNRVIEMQNKELKEQKEEILKQKEEIEEQKNLTQKQYKIILKQKEHITDSIVYASTIQRSLLPDEIEFLDSYDFFILFRPKEIVSGDFYWFYKKEKRLFVAAADCTGHGVPGAFMSVMGITFLNDIVSKSRKDVMPNEILEELRNRIIKAFEKKNTTETRQDGMDIALYIVEPDRRTLHFAGANNSLFLVRKTIVNNFPQDSNRIKITVNDNYSLIELKPDKMPIGNYIQIKPFRSYTLKIYPNDRLYTFSDGIVDQFGGEYGRRFGTTRFKKLLLSVQDLSMKEQEKVIGKTVDDWINNSNVKGISQLDDMLIIGLEIV